MGQKTVIRRKILVDKKFQLQYFYIWLWVGVGMVVMSMLFYLLGSRVLGERALDPQIVKLMSGMSGFLVLFCVLMGLLSVFLTHRVAGAAYRLELCIRDMTEGASDRRIALRAGDYLQNIAEALNELQDTLRDQTERRTRLATQLEELRDRLEKTAAIGENEKQCLNAVVAGLRGVYIAVDKKEPPAA